VKTIPAVHASQFKPFISLLADVGAPITRLLERESISPTILETQSQLVSIQRAFTFVENAGRTQHIDDIGWQAGYEQPLLSSGSWAREASRASTLREALGVLIRGYPRVVPLLQLGLTANRESAWLWRRRLIDLKSNPGQTAVEQFTLGRFLKLIRYSAGEEWTPKRIKVECPQARSPVPRQRSWADTRVEYLAPVLAIEIPLELLDLPMPLSGSQPTHSNLDDELPVPTLERFLWDSLQHDIHQCALTVESAAEIVGTSGRTLRRHLQEEGVGWRTIRDRLLHRRSRSLLRNTDLSIGQIALEMG
jgi:AraC-like DNA-binding protein